MHFFFLSARETKWSHGAMAIISLSQGKGENLSYTAKQYSMTISQKEAKRENLDYAPKQQPPQLAAPS